MNADHPHVVQDLREEARSRAGAGSRARPRPCTGRPASSARRPRDGRGRPRTPASSTGRSTSSSRRTCPSCRCRAPPRRHRSGTPRASTVGWRASGDPPPGGKSTSSGSCTGSSSSGTATSPHVGQCTIGIGVPQYRCRDMQPVAEPEVHGRAPAALIFQPGGDLRDRLGRAAARRRAREFTITPSPGYASAIEAPSSGSSRLDRPRAPARRARARTRSRAHRARAPP